MKQLFLLVCTAMLLATGCKKEYQQTPYNYTDILSFAYTDSAGAIHKAAIHEDSIIVYWPQRITGSMDITPTIVVAENAKVSPAAGSSIELATGTPITVTAEDGTQKVYYIKLIQNLPDIFISEGAGAGYPISRGSAYEFWINGNTAIRNIYTDALDTKAFAVADDGTEFELQVSFPAENRMRFAIGYDIALGDYRLKVINAGRMQITEGKKVRIQYLPQYIHPIATDITIKRGGTISLEGEFSQDFSNVYPDNFDLRLQKVVYDTVSAYPKWGEVLYTEYLPGTFTFVGHTDSTITFSVPTDVPVGRYIYSEEFSGHYKNGITYRFMRTDHAVAIRNKEVAPILTITD